MRPGMREIRDLESDIVEQFGLQCNVRLEVDGYSLHRSMSIATVKPEDVVTCVHALCKYCFSTFRGGGGCLVMPMLAFDLVPSV